MAEGVSVTYDLDSHQLGAEARGQGMTVAYDSDGLSASYTNGGLTLAYDQQTGISANYGDLSAAYSNDGRLTGSYGAVTYNNGQWGIDPTGIRSMLISAGSTYVNNLVNQYASEFALPGQIQLGISANGQLTGSYSMGGLTFGSNGNVSGNIGGDTPFGALGLNVQDGNVTAGMATDYGNIGLDSRGRPTGSIAAGPLGLGMHDGQLTGQSSIGPINLDYTDGQFGGGMELGGSNVSYGNGSWGGTVEGNAVEQALGGAGVDTSGFEITDATYNANTGWDGAFSNGFGTWNQDGQYSATVIPDDGDQSTTWPAVQEVAIGVKTTVSDIWASIFGGEKPAEQPQVVVTEGTTPTEQQSEGLTSEELALLESEWIGPRAKGAGDSPDVTMHTDGSGFILTDRRANNRQVTFVPTRIGNRPAFISRPPGETLLKTDTGAWLRIYKFEGNNFVANLGKNPKAGRVEALTINGVPMVDGSVVQRNKSGALAVVTGALPKNSTVYVNGADTTHLDGIANLAASQANLAAEPIFMVYNATACPAGVTGVKVCLDDFRDADSSQEGPAFDPEVSTRVLARLIESGAVRTVLSHSHGSAIAGNAMLRVAQTKPESLHTLEWLSIGGVPSKNNIPSGVGYAAFYWNSGDPAHRANWEGIDVDDSLVEGYVLLPDTTDTQTAEARDGILRGRGYGVNAAMQSHCTSTSPLCEHALVNYADSFRHFLQNRPAR